MKESNLRLRLVVRRHSLPDVRVIFSISLADEPTIANLLEQVNDAVPLESRDWGLDDYVVELGDDNGHAYECLHFQPVATILFPDNEVVIRPLLTVDRKKRLLSGRDQISTDGKHLVDGVPFGRPRLRTPRGRPPVDIPPLKRRRIAFERDEEDEDDDEDYREDGKGIEDDDEEDAPLMLTENGEEEDEPSMVRVEAMFDDADNGDGEDEQVEEEDFNEDEAEDEEEDDLDEDEIDEAELLDELRDIQKDNEMLEDEDPSPRQHQPEPARHIPVRQTPAESEADADLARLNKITALRRAFPAVDCHVYEDVLRRNALNERMAYRELSRSYEASMSLEQMGELLASFSLPVLPSSNNFDAGAEDDEEGGESDAESTSSLVKLYDQRGFPSGSILDGSASRAAVEALRKAGHEVKAPVLTRFDDGGAERDEATARQQVAGKLGKYEVKAPEPVSSEDDGDSSESSSSDSEEGEESEEEDSEDDEDFEDGRQDGSDSDSDGTSSDSDGSDEDSGPEVAPTKAPTKSDVPRGGGGGSGTGTAHAEDASQSKKRKRGPGGTDKADSSSSADSPDSSSESDSDESSSDDSSDDDSIKAATSTSTLGSAKLPPNKSTVTQPQPDTAAKRTPPGQGLSKTKARNVRRRIALKAKKEAPAKSASPSAAAETGETSNSEFLQRKQALLEQLAKDNSQPVSSPPKDAPADIQADLTVVTRSEELPDSEASATAMASSSQRRSKLDVGAGRRMLFASLGLRNPKTKADEDKIRDDLMKGVRPLLNHRITEASATASATEKADSIEANPASEETPADDPEAWKDKIIYRAVECVQEGVELSEPPFPFVQRWDPQQQHGFKNKRGGRGKRKERNQSDFYEDDGSSLPTAKKQRHNHAGEDTSFKDVELNYDDIPDKTVTEPPSQLTDLDDLPSVPKNLSTVPALQLSEAKPGMVIAWKQMLVSKATKWAPQILDLTAVIVSVDEAAGELRVVLARRDRHLDGMEKTFDEEGNRVYDRFDAPDDDHDDAGEDAGGDNTEGYRTVQFFNMMDPRIVQQPLPSLEKATPLRTIVESQDQADTVMADHEGLADEAVAKEADDEPDGDIPGKHQEKEGVVEADVQAQDDRPEESSYPSVIPDSVPQDLDDAPASELADDPIDDAQDVSITDDARHDISLLIQEAGFRADVSPSVAKEARFTVEDLSSPSRQLDEEMSDAAAAASHHGSTTTAQPPSSRESSSLRDVTMPSLDGPSGKQPAAENEQDTPKANAPRDTTPTVAYPQLPQLPPPSSSSSIRSGRQPDNETSMDWGDDDYLFQRSEELGEDLSALNNPVSDPDTTPRKPTCTLKSLADESDNPFDSSPLPTIDEIFSTAPIRSSQSPVRAKLSGATASRTQKQDLEYEEIMRRVEDESEGGGWEEDQDQIQAVRSPPPPGSAGSITWDERRGEIKKERWNSQAVASKISSLRKAVSPPSQMPKHEPASSQSRPLPFKKRPGDTSSQKSSSRFSAIPPGSQVHSLLTSSEPEPEAEEDYADDSVDSTYHSQEQDDEDDDGDLPGGSGWVKKALPSKAKGKKSKVTTGGRGRRGVSLSALPGPVGGGKMGGKGRRKTSGKF